MIILMMKLNSFGSQQDEKDFEEVEQDNPQETRPLKAKPSEKLRTALYLIFISASAYMSITKNMQAKALLVKQSQKFELDKMILPYSSLGIPQKGQRFDHRAIKTDDFTIYDSELLKMLQPFDDTNCQLSRFGSPNEGGYLLCQNILKESKAIVSIGTRVQNDFDCQLVSKLGIPSHQYSCSGLQHSTCRVKQERQFINSCFSHKQIGTFFNLSRIIQAQQLQQKSIVLKVSFQEGQEYHILRLFPTELLDVIDQLVITFNFPFSAVEAWGNLNIFRSITSKMTPVNFQESNRACFSPKIQAYRKLVSRQLDLTFVNKKLIKKHSENRSWSPHPLNAKNDVNSPPC